MWTLADMLRPKLPRDHRETGEAQTPQLWTYKAHKAMVEWTLRIRKEPGSSLGHHGTDISSRDLSLIRWNKEEGSRSRECSCTKERYKAFKEPEKEV